MSVTLLLLTVLCVTGISIGQLLFKKAAMALPVNAQWVDWVFNGWLVVALALYGVTTVLWVWILRDILQNLPASRVDVTLRWHPIEP